MMMTMTKRVRGLCSVEEGGMWAVAFWSAGRGWWIWNS